MKKTVESVIYEHLVIFIILWEVLRAEQYVIIQRRSTVITHASSSTFKVQPDRFVIPSSRCVGNGFVQCKEMGGSRVGNCTCECNRMASDGANFSSSTFGFDGGRRKCLENTKVHERSGCSVILNYWANDSSLITVPNVGIAHYEIPTQFRGFHIYKPISKAQNCNGSWSDLDYDPFVKERFSVHEVHNRQYLNFNYSGNSSQQLTSGRIIKLGVGYHDASHKIIHTCVLLKMEGTIKCPFSLPPNAIPSTTEPSFSSTTVEGSLSTSARSITNPNTQSSRSTVTTSTGETLAPMVIKTRSKNTSSSDGRSGLIAGAVASVVGLIVLVIAVILVRRRKKRTTAAKRTNEVQEENGFGTNRVQPASLEDQDEYSYAYASAVSINKRHVDHHPENREDSIPVVCYVNQAHPAFNISDELEYEIMPNTETDESKGIKQEEDTSKTLDSAMYSSLVGNEPHVYGSLKGPHKRHEDETDRQVACTSQNKKDDTYQQLDTFGQQNHGEYQALKYKGKPAHAVKMNSRVY